MTTKNIVRCTMSPFWEEEMKERCKEFFDILAEKLTPTYTKFGDISQVSKYLIPAGTDEEVTYYSKPDYSFRVSDHWNWYANVKKCPDESYVQCFCEELLRPKRRKEPGLPSTPIFAINVSFFDPADKRYHVVYGEYWDKKVKAWRWIESNPDEIARKALSRMPIYKLIEHHVIGQLKMASIDGGTK